MSSTPPPFLQPGPGPGYERWRAATNAGAYRRPLEPGRPKYWLHIVLFLLTVGTTTFAYGFRVLPNGALYLNWGQGLQYSFWLLLILGCHEFGHYFAAQRHRVKATLPFFIPLPLPPLGTMGAVIRMSPYIPNRRALFDIAAAGPLAGIIIAIPVAFVGMMSAVHVPIDSPTAMRFADPLLLRAMEWLVVGTRPEGYDILLGPMGFAGWVGMFVTALNLLPISQLDGGHISYAVFGRRSRFVAFGVFGSLVVYMMFNGWQYVLLLALVWYAGLAHPPTLDDGVEIGRGRRLLAVLLLVIFVLCFTPKPIVDM